MNAQLPPVIATGQQSLQPPVIKSQSARPPFIEVEVVDAPRWFQFQIPWKLLLQFAFCLAFVAVVIASGRWAISKAQLQRNREQVQFVSALEVMPKGDLRANAAMCTQNGFELWRQLEFHFPGRQCGYEVEGVNNTGDLSEVALVRRSVDGVSRLHIQLKRESTGWKFNDIYLGQINGRNLNLWYSFVVAHPILSQAQYYKPELLQIYSELKGAAQGAAGVMHDTATLVTGLKGF